MISLLAMLLLAATPSATARQSPAVDTARQLLQLAVHLEEAIGDPDAAIAAYEMVLAAPDDDAPAAAVAEFRLAMLLSAIGRLDEARQHNLRITERYADNPALEQIVQLARAALGEATRYRDGRSMVARQLWEGSAGYAFGALSPDGSFISYVDWASGNLAIHDLDRGVERFITNLSPALLYGAGSSSVVSPDNDRIAYTWYTPETGYEVRTVRFDGSDNRTLLSGLTTPLHIELEGWSADGRDLLAIVSVDESTHDLALIDTRNGTIYTAARLGTTAPEVARLSPNGRWIAYQLINDDGTHDILLTATDGSITTKLVDHPADDLLPIWTADGRYLLFVSDRSGSAAAWIVEVSNQGEPLGDARLLKPDFGRSVPMGFTRDGALIYAQQMSLNDIYTAPLSQDDGTLGVRIPVGGRLVGVNRSPQLSADGRRMVYVSEPGLVPANLGPRTLTVRDVESGRRLTLSPALRRILPPRWHPDGETLIAEALGKDNQWGIYAIDADTSEIELLVGWPGATCGCSASPVVSPDGASLAYFRPTAPDAGGDLVVRRLATGAEVTLVGGILARDVADMDFSPDGRQLATAIRPRNRDRAAGWRLQFLDVATGRRVDVTSLGTNYEVLTLSGWTDGGEGLLFVRAEDDRHSLGWVSADGQDLAWLILELPWDIRDVQLHRRYDRLVFATAEYRAEVWMLENPLAALASR